MALRVTLEVKSDFKENMGFTPRLSHKMTQHCALDRTPVYGSATIIVAVVRGQAAGILEKSHKVKKNWKKFNLKEFVWGFLYVGVLNYFFK